jgi:dolichol-phosphate mannosyltransferase
MPITLLAHQVNMGLGEAMKTGFKHLAETASGDDLVVTMDADNTHDPHLILKMKEKIDSGAGLDIVIASRYAEGGKEVGLELLRRILSRGASLLLQFFFNVEGASDYTCGFRMYRASIIKGSLHAYGESFIEEKSFVCMAEILIKAFYAGARIGEAPLVLRYDLKEGRSKMKKLRTIMKYARLMARGKRRIIRLRRS